MRAFSEGFSGVPLKRGSSEDPRAVRERVASFDLSSLGRQPQRLCRNPQKARSIGEIEPGLDPVVGGLERWDAMVRTQRGDAFAGPAVAMAGLKPIA
jgi:hypothetical protein